MKRHTTLDSIVGTIACMLLAASVAAGAGEPDARAQEFARLAKAVQEHFAARDYEQAATDCRGMIRLAPDHPTPHYNLACALARLKRPEEALAALEMAVFKGFNQAEHMGQDDDLAALRGQERFAKCVEKAKENERTGGAPYEPGVELAGVKTVEGFPEGGLRYRLRMSPTATAAKPDRLIVWLHPAGGSANRVAEPLATRFAKLGFALLVLTQKEWRAWSGADVKKLFERTLPEVAKTPGIDAERPLLMGYSAGGQVALLVWQGAPGKFGGLVLDAAYPVRAKPGGFDIVPLPEDPGVKQTPLFVLVGELDGGSQVWRKVEPEWRKAGVPLTLRTVPGQKHAWLFGPSQLDELDAWLREVKAGKLPTDPPPM